MEKRRLIATIAEQRIEILFSLAWDIFPKDPELARRYVKLIKELGRHYRIKIPKEIKHSICKKCNGLLVPGRNVLVRLASSKGFVVYKCLNCGAELHVYYKPWRGT